MHVRSYNLYVTLEMDVFKLCLRTDNFKVTLEMHLSKLFVRTYK